MSALAFALSVHHTASRRALMALAPALDRLLLVDSQQYFMG